ncbi:MAG: lysylphosphatidylglycerol synthase transmembrane domain-containing protein, partial [Bacteroidota bacterium]
MLRSKRAILKIAIPLLIGLALVWYSFSKISIEELWAYARGANYWYILLGVLLGVLSHTSRAYRWLYMAEPMGYKPKFLNSFMAVYSAYLINFTVPRAGEIARASILTNYENIPFQKGFGTIVAERVADTIMLLLIITVAMFYQFDFLVSFFSEKFNIGAIVLILLAGLGLFLLAAIVIKRSNNHFA